MCSWQGFSGCFIALVGRLRVKFSQSQYPYSVGDEPQTPLSCRAAEIRSFKTPQASRPCAVDPGLVCHPSFRGDWRPHRGALLGRTISQELNLRRSYDMNNGTIYNRHRLSAKNTAISRRSREFPFSVDTGEFVCLTGKSGSGKTTLLSLLSGLERPTSGHVKLDGKDITNATEDELALFRRENVGFIFQSFNLIPTLSAWENVALPLFPVRMKRVMKGNGGQPTSLRGWNWDIEWSTCPLRSLGGGETAGSYCEGLGHPPEGPLCRRTDRQPRFCNRGCHHGDFKQPAHTVEKDWPSSWSPMKWHLQKARIDRSACMTGRLVS